MVTELGMQRYLLASDFDQTLSFNDSGIALSEMLGISGFLEKCAGLSRMHLVQHDGSLGASPVIWCFGPGRRAPGGIRAQRQRALRWGNPRYRLFSPAPNGPWPRASWWSTTNRWSALSSLAS